MPVPVKPLTLPAAGMDFVKITLQETYEVDGIGKDTVTLNGTLVANRAAPLLNYGAKAHSWENSTVVAQFTKLSLAGESHVFGPIAVSLDTEHPAFGVVSAGKCRAALGVEVAMPKHNLVLRSEEPMQLQSDVKTVPPIGDEKTESVHPVRLVDTSSGRNMGTLDHSRVMWRELTRQVPHVESPSH